MCGMPSTGAGSTAGGSKRGILKNGVPQSAGRGGRIGIWPAKNFACFSLPTSRPITTCTRLPSIPIASLRSGHYLQVNGAKVRNERNPVMGMYPAKNGRWSYVHANFPNHRAAALRVLGCEENREAVRRAGGAVPNIPETQEYVRKVVALYQAYKAGK